MAVPGEVEWRLSQAFTEKRPGELTEGDPITAVEFDETGDYIATGDKGGRVVIYERSNKEPKAGPSDLRRSIGLMNNKPQSIPEYKRYTDYLSHEPEFDYLKSLEIEEKINKIKFCKRTSGALLLLTTNDKTIKLWKVNEKRLKTVTTNHLDTNGVAPGRPPHPSQLRLPRVSFGELLPHAMPRRVFANAHAYHVNSISLNSDGETYISSDDLRINLWNLNITDQSFNIVDIKPANMEDLTEVITRGSVKLADMRQAALCDQHAKVFEEEEDPGSKSFFSEIIASISDVKFSRDGRYILSRDYMTLKIWDLNMENKPVKTIPIHEQLRPKLCDLYENDCIFDKFECAFSHDGNYVLTGSYNDFFHVYDRHGRTDACMEASKGPPKNKQRASSSKGKLGLRIKKGKGSDEPSLENLDYAKKILHVSWHPHTNVLAVSAQNSLYVYTQ
eukprot:tig00000553_g2097.t1